MNLNLTILGQAIAFALFVWFCLKFVWPPLTNALKERQQKIADGLDAAESAQMTVWRLNQCWLKRSTKAKTKQENC